jgi:hypothetical protein
MILSVGIKSWSKWPEHCDRGGDKRDKRDKRKEVDQ